MVQTGKIVSILFPKSRQKVQSETSAKKYEFFPSNNNVPQDNYTSTGDWNSSLNPEFEKLGIGTYTWTPFNGFDDAILKSQDNLIDLLRLYEGDRENNYKAKTSFKDSFEKGTYGFGLTDFAMNALKERGYNFTPPKTQNEAYTQLLTYLNVISKDEVENYIGKDLFNKLPDSIKAALLDYQFKNGTRVMGKISKLKPKIEQAAKTNKAADWAEVLKELVYAYPASLDVKQVENPGIYRRSLSRVILAAKGLKQSMSKNDAAIIDKAVKEVYDSAVKCAKNNKKQSTDFDKIYNAYTDNKSAVTTTTSAAPQTQSSVNYYETGKKTLFAVANAIMPKNMEHTKNGIDDKEMRILIIKEIMNLNGIKDKGTDSSGYPKVDSLATRYKIPSSITIKRKTTENKEEEIKIPLGKPPKDWKLLSAENKEPAAKAEQKPVAKVEQKPAAKAEQKQSDNQELGTYTVEPKDSYWQIARKIAPKDYNEQQLKELVAKISSLNNNKELNVGDVIKIPNIKQNSSVSENKKSTAQTKPKQASVDSTETTQKAVKKEAPKNEVQSPAAKTLNSKEIDEDEPSNYVHIVKKSETMASIAKKYGLTEDELKDLNGVKEIKKGDKIELPFYAYKTAKGETLAQISENTGMSVKELKAVNKLKSDKIKPNHVLLIPKDEFEIITAKLTDEDRKYLVMRTEDGKIVATRHEFVSKRRGPLSGKTIFVNAGHGYTSDGNIDRGTNLAQIKVSPDGTPDEYLCNYDNAMRLKDELIKKGANVIYLQGHVNLIQEELTKERNKADLFISLHINSNDTPTQDRTEFYYTSYGKNDKYKKDSDLNRLSKMFAMNLEDRFDEWISNNEDISDNDKFYKLIDDKKVQDYALTKTKGLLVCKEAERSLKCPAVLWEVAYISTEKGRERLRTVTENYMKNAAKVIENFILNPTDLSQFYEVKAGNTLGKIASDHGLTLSELLELNNMSENATIDVGDELRIKRKSE